MGFGPNLYRKGDPVELRYPVPLALSLDPFLIPLLKHGSCWGRGKLSQVSGRVTRDAFVTSHIYSKEENVLAIQKLFPGAGVGFW